jgi:hypothetical protein
VQFHHAGRLLLKTGESLVPGRRLPFE